MRRTFDDQGLRARMRSGKPVKLVLGAGVSGASASSRQSTETSKHVLPCPRSRGAFSAAAVGLTRSERHGQHRPLRVSNSAGDLSAATNGSGASRHPNARHEELRAQSLAIRNGRSMADVEPFVAALRSPAEFDTRSGRCFPSPSLRVRPTAAALKAPRDRGHGSTYFDVSEPLAARSTRAADARAEHELHGLSGAHARAKTLVVKRPSHVARPRGRNANTDASNLARSCHDRRRNPDKSRPPPL